MKTIEVIQRGAADGMLHLSIPVDDVSREYILRVDVFPTDPTDEELEARGWSPGFFERTAGKWVGDFKRGPQGEFEKRLEM